MAASKNVMEGKTNLILSNKNEIAY